MKAQILKIAGVKSEKEFYKKYPSEEAFMKVHGKEFKKAQMGVQLEKAQTGADINRNEIPDYLESAQGVQGPQNQWNFNNSLNVSPITAPSINTMSNNAMPAPKNPFAMKNIGDQWAKNHPLPKGVHDYSVPDSIGGASAGGGMAGAMPYMQAGMDVVQGLSMIKGQKNRVKQARQQAGVTGVQAQAAESRDVDTRRQQQDYFGRKRNALMRPINGEELFPVDGVGTNVLARDGAEIQNTYAPDNLYDDLGYEPLNDSEQVKQFQFGGNMFPTGMTSQQGNISQYGDMASNLSNRFINQGGQEDAGSMIGGGIGAGIGTAFGGPIGGAIGKFAGKTIGGLIDTSDKKIAKYNKQTDKNIERITGQAFAQNLQQQNQSYMEDGGYVNPEYNPQLITMFGDHDASDFADYANKFRAGGHLKSYTAPSERAMETYEEGGDIQSYALGGELQTHWGGGAETLSQNPYLPSGGETIMFRGKSHEERSPNGETGIGVTYGDSPVEVERGEPAIKLKDGTSGEENLTVYGNLQIPDQYVDVLGDPKAKGKKFKNYIAEISKKENNQNKIINKSSEELDSLDVKNSFDKLKLTSLQANIQGANMKLKDIADKKEKAAYLQNAINDTAEEQGLVADDLARGKYKIDKEAMFGQAKFGGKFSKAKEGEVIDPPSGSKGNIDKNQQYKYKAKGNQALDYTAIGKDNPNEMFSSPERYAEYVKETNAAYDDPEIAKELVNYFQNFDGEDWQDVRANINKGRTFEERVAIARKLATDGLPGRYHINTGKFAKKPIPVPEKLAPAVKPIEETVPTEPIPYKRNVLMDIYNQALPYIRKMPNERLDPRQLYGEMYGLSNNQLEPVDAQFYRPQLDVPYDISLQDQRNEVTAQTRAAQRMVGYNPAAQAMIAAQAYEPLNKITGEEFRLNQAMKDRVYSGNRATLNDAQLKNLAIADQQYERQSQARSNTKAITQAALQSIGDKYVQNALENRKERIQSNLYPQYSFDSEGRVINTGQLTQFNIPTVGSAKGTQTQVPVYDDNGNLVKYQLQKYDPSADGGVGTPPLVPLSKNGKSIKARNGSIVKSYKNL
jgi:hypothetical protein